MFNSGETVKTIQLTIINDSIPELAESIKVNLTSVSLVTSRTMNYGFVNGLQIDIPPKIGSPSSAEIFINENDQPYGTIEFVQTRLIVHERDGRVLIPVNRTGKW